MSVSRTRARRLALQGLYEWQMSENSPDEIFARLKDTKEAQGMDVDYFQELMQKISTQAEILDKQLQPFIGRDLDDIDGVERATLRLGAYELIERQDIPYRVAINEAVELAKRYGADQGHKFVNGILDKLATEVRAVEITAKIKTKKKTAKKTAKKSS